MCVIAVATLLAGLVVIGPEERGVVISALDPKGYCSAPLLPGPHWTTPLLQRVQVYSIAPQTYTMAAGVNNDAVGAITKDGRLVSIDVSVTYAVDPATVVALYATWQDRYQENLIRPLTRAATRDIVAQFSAAELVGNQKAHIGQLVFAQLEPEFNNNYVIPKDFAIQDVRLGGG